MGSNTGGSAATLFRVTERVKTPMALSGLVVVALYLVFSRVLSLPVFGDLGQDHTYQLLHEVLRYVFWLAIVAVLLGAGSFVLALVLRHRIDARGPNVQLIDARLDPHDSPYEQEVVDGERRIRRRKPKRPTAR